MTKKRTVEFGVYLILVFIFFLCKASSCRRDKNCPEGSHDQLIIQNNSAIAVNWRKEDSPDTIWTNNGEWADENMGLILAGTSKFYNPGLYQCWENRFSESRSDYYFIFSHDTVKAIGWKQISGTNRGLLKKVKVDLEYLKKNSFTITYP